MTAPDPTYVRKYRTIADRNHRAAISRCDALLADVEVLRTKLANGALVPGYDAASAATSAMLLAQFLTALEALREVEFLTTDPDEPVEN
jgi:hypothetical protein